MNGDADGNVADDDQCPYGPAPQASAEGVVSGTGSDCGSGGGGASGVVTLATITTTGSQTSVTFSGYSASYTHLRIIGIARSATSATSDNLLIEFNGDTTSGDYVSQLLQGVNTVASASTSTPQGAGLLAGATASANQAGTVDILIPLYAGTTFLKQWQGTSGTPGFPVVRTFAGKWNATTALTSVTLFLTSGAAFVDGSVFTLVGIP